jgi:DNA-binding protein H-NS
MSVIDISHLTLEQLGHLRIQIDDLLRIKRAERVANARQQILAIVDDIGASLEEVMDSEAAPRKPKYAPIHHPDFPGLAWSGRGRHPNWVKELLAAGKSLDDLREALQGVDKIKLDRQVS